MAELNSLESLQALYADLLALSESRLSNLERLGAQLDAHMKDFRNLLDKKARNDESRKSLLTGKLDVSGDQYSINEEFQQNALKLADELNLDELDAARIFLEAQDEAESSGRPVLTVCLIRFHQRRKVLLDCLRLLLQQSADIDLTEALREDLQSLVAQIVMPQGGSARYTARCLTSMNDIKKWLQTLADKGNKSSVLGQQTQEILQAIEYQRASLVSQHQCLGAIMLYLVKENHATVADFDTLLETLKGADKYDNILVHSLPILTACITRFGGIEAVGGLADARSLHKRLLPSEEKPWVLPYVQATFRVLWLAEYAGWYGENHDGSLPENQLEEETRTRYKQFSEALRDGAFDFLLSVSFDVKSVEWHDPARYGLRQWLQRKAPVILADSISFDSFFQLALMEQLENFVECFITNMPDVLRKLRAEEDEQRQLSKDREHDLDLERFIVIISNAFEGRPKAALEAFWDVPDGSMIGFVHWASKRASTPLVSAFCEMLQSISEDEECATAAHHFLLDEGTSASGKMKKTQNLTWAIIFNELKYFMNQLNPALPQPQSFRPGNPQAAMSEVDPEQAIMIECYLRLITRLAAESDAARAFFAHNSAFHLSEMLFQLASSAVGSRLRACAFTALRSLLNRKTREAGEYIWAALDVWITGGYSPASMMSKTSNATSTTTAASMGAILAGLASGYEEPNAFVQLLHALVLPYSDDTGLHDELPFPENLGVSLRQPGIDPYVDFALGNIFGRPLADPNDSEVVQRRLLQLTCLDFIATCLETFNEDLIILANQSNISMDAAIKASSLQTYVMLHPFSRVMEWMFNDKIMSALFTIVHQDPVELASSAPDSPLILCLLRGIHVINSILELQPTYLDIIRPLIKSQPNHRRSPVSNAAFGSFEDGILGVNRLQIFPDLGRYCGTGHPELVIASLKLLERLSSSSKLTMPPSGLGRGSGRNRTLSILDDHAETVSAILLQELESDIDINQGPESASYIIKVHILDFIIACLRTSPGEPNIAHLLLGFKCGKEGISIDPESSFDRGISLFHTILDLVVNFPMVDEAGVASWLMSLKLKGLQIIKELWISPMSSSFIIAELRANNFLFIMFVREIVIQPGLTWDGLDLSDPSFSLSPAVSCLSEFLGRRALILQYLSTELRQVTHGSSPSLKQRILETLLGSTTSDDGQRLDHATIFDLFDFMEWDFDNPTMPPQLVWFDDLDLLACVDDPSDPSSTHNITKVEELLVLRRAELSNSKRLDNPQDLVSVNIQAQELINYVTESNRIKILETVRMQVLKAWVQLLLVMLESGDFDDTSRTSLVLRALQTIMPRLESDSEVVVEASELARLAKALLFSLDFSSDSFKKGDMADLVGERLFALFQISLTAINTLGTKVSLKEFYYNICFRYMVGMSEAGLTGLRRRHSIQTIKSAGERFIDVICDDASGGEPTCRISALLVLGALIKLGEKEKSKYIIESLMRLNFIALLVQSVQSIPTDLRNTAAEDIATQLSYSHARLTLLLQISQSRFGAAAVCNAGLFHFIRESELFAVDPDLGVDIPGPNAVEKHYELLGALMRIICAAILSRGPQNQQTLDHGRRFLVENRLSILGVLKKSAGLGVTTGVSEECITDLAESYILLISFTGFLEFEDQNIQKRPAPTMYTSFT